MSVRPLPGQKVAEFQEAATLFQTAYAGSRAQEYVTARGISDRAASALRLGLVPAGTEGFEQFANRLAVPYLNMRKQVTGFKFRSLDPESDAKYLALDGWATTLYNIQALNTPQGVLALTEGEADTWTMTTLGIPALGVPGVNNWKPHHKRILDGFTILYWPHDDKAGHGFAKSLKEFLPEVVMCQIPGGCNDLNESLLAGYGDRIREMFSVYTTEGTAS
jgi:DNA primase